VRYQNRNDNPTEIPSGSFSLTAAHTLIRVSADAANMAVTRHILEIGAHADFPRTDTQAAIHEIPVARDRAAPALDAAKRFVAHAGHEPHRLAPAGPARDQNAPADSCQPLPQIRPARALLDHGILVQLRCQAARPAFLPGNDPTSARALEQSVAAQVPHDTGEGAPDTAQLVQTPHDTAGTGVDNPWILLPAHRAPECIVRDNRNQRPGDGSCDAGRIGHRNREIAADNDDHNHRIRPPDADSRKCDNSAADRTHHNHGHRSGHNPHVVPWNLSGRNNLP